MARHPRTSYAALSVLALFAAGATSAASISAQPRKDYGRINFTFGTPTAIRSAANGTSATITFSTPLEESPQTIAAALPNYVKTATLSADKKTLTLALTKPYRIRQFTSGTRVGIDLIERTDSAPRATDGPAPAPMQSAEADMLTTKKPPAAAPAPTKKPATPAKTAEKKTAAAKPAPRKQEAPKPSAMLTTKKAPEPVAAPEKPKAPPAEHTTKAPEPVAPAPAPEAPAAPAKAAVAEAAPEAQPATVAQAAPAPATPFSVAVSATDTQTELYFPWQERTAAAVFRRGGDVWIVFSRFMKLDTAALVKNIPQHVVKAVQYADSNNTILRLMTDGSVNARVMPEANGFGWRIALAQSPSAPAQEVNVTTDSLEGTERLLLGVYDIAPSLRFYDPAVGDQLVIIPSYEVGRAVGVPKNYPQLSILPTAQGVAMVSRVPELRIHQSRAGTTLSMEGGLALSESLPVVAGAAPASTGAASTGIMMPYEQWYVPPEHFREALSERLHAVASADAAGKAESMMEVVKLYLSYGMGPEAYGVLEQIRTGYTQYYTENKLALLSGVTNVLMQHIDAATNDFSAPELNNLEEAILWRQVAGLYATPLNAAQKLADAVAASTPTSDSSANSPQAAPTAEAAAAIKASNPGFQFLKYSRPYIRFYPPRIRQKLATIAADAYLADGQAEKALAVYDTLLRDNILTPLKQEAEFALGAVAAKKAEVDQALEIFDRVATQKEDPRSAARAIYAGAMLRYEKGKIEAGEALEIIEQARLRWRGDQVEREMLAKLITLYTDSKRYDEVLRTQRTMLEAFPRDPEALDIATNMSNLFRRLYLEGQADEMEPLAALSLFYEFRDLTPINEDGDLMIQKLADRLAALDLLDRAAKLLDNQVKYRVKGENRSRVGARLALLHLLNKNPQEALNILQVTNFGSNTPELQTVRQQLLAESLMKLEKYEEALGVIYTDATPAGTLLRLDVLWAMKDWPNIINRAEEMLNSRPNLTEPLSTRETEVLLKLALAYTFESDYTQLRYLRDYYSALIPDTGYKQIFDYITNDATPLDPEDFSLLARQISRTEGFLDTFKSKIAAGKLSEAVK